MANKFVIFSVMKPGSISPTETMINCDHILKLEPSAPDRSYVTLINGELLDTDWDFDKALAHITDPNYQ